MRSDVPSKRRPSPRQARAQALSRSANTAPTPTNPLQPLITQLSRAVLQELGKRQLLAEEPGPGRGAAQRTTVRLTTGAHGLGEDLGHAVAQVLERALDDPSTEGRKARIALITRLLNRELDEVRGHPLVPPTESEKLLTTSEAAALLEVSRPYVSMLCDAGKLGTVVLTEGGHRRIRAEALTAYIASRRPVADQTTSPRQAGVAADLYSRSDEDYRYVARGKKGGQANAARARPTEGKTKRAKRA